MVAVMPVVVLRRADDPVERGSRHRMLACSRIAYSVNTTVMIGTSPAGKPNNTNGGPITRPPKNPSNGCSLAAEIQSRFSLE